MNSQTPGASGIALEIHRITKRYPGVLANDDVSLAVAPGEVHAILGENGAGKSTLMNVVYGLTQPDSGYMSLYGEVYKPKNPQDSLHRGVGMVHQHFTLVPDMTVLENLSLRSSRLPGRLRADDLRKQLGELIEKFDLHLDLDARIDSLPIGAQQRVEVLKALHRQANLLILDEPSAALSPIEWKAFTGFLRAMVSEGKSVVIITHKLDEIVDVADRCTIMRDGRVVETVDVAAVSQSQLASAMVGREVSLQADRPAVEIGSEVLTVTDLSLRHDDRRQIRGVSLSIRAGEVVGIAGVSGNGQNELVDCIVGLTSDYTGSISISGHLLRPGEPRHFVEAGGALVPESRHSDGVATKLSVWENLVVRDLAQHTRFGIVNERSARSKARTLISDYGVKCRSVESEVGQLSGGNQQKVILAREFSRDPRLVVAFQPTLGLDAGAIELVYRRINEQKKAGAAVLLISYELDELRAVCDRFAVMSRGSLSRMYAPDQLTVNQIGLLMMGAE